MARSPLRSWTRGVRGATSGLPRRRTRRGKLGCEPLEARTMLAADPIISEFMAINSSTIADGEGRNSDWIEIHNPGDAPIDLVGWHLTDNESNPTKWTFPSVVVPAGGYLVVFASEDNTPP